MMENFRDLTKCTRGISSIWGIERLGADCLQHLSIPFWLDMGNLIHIAIMVR